MHRCLAPIPEYSSAKVKGPAPTVTDPNSIVAEAYHFVVSSLKLALRAIDGNTVVVTSTGPEDGKTVTSLNLAVAAAGSGQQPLLIDADERTLGLTTLANLANVPGLTDLGATEGDATDLIRQWGVGAQTELLFVPAGSSRSTDPARFFRSPAFQQAMPALTAGQESRHHRCSADPRRRGNDRHRPPGRCCADGRVRGNQPEEAP